MFKVDVYLFGVYHMSRTLSSKAEAINYVKNFNDGNTVSKAIHAW